MLLEMLLTICYIFMILWWEWKERSTVLLFPTHALRWIAVKMVRFLFFLEISPGGATVERENNEQSQNQPVGIQTCNTVDLMGGFFSDFNQQKIVSKVSRSRFGNVKSSIESWWVTTHPPCPLYIFFFVKSIWKSGMKSLGRSHLGVAG